jgi:hypothetical protein
MVNLIIIAVDPSKNNPDQNHKQVDNGCQTENKKQPVVKIQLVNWKGLKEKDK